MVNLIYGINTVLHAIDAKQVRFVYLQKEKKSPELLNLFATNKISFKIVERQVLNKLANNENHQGIVAEVIGYSTLKLEELLNKVKDHQKSILLMLDGIEDPHNLGAILRVADAFGVDGVIFKNSHQVGLNATVAKVSTGAINYVDCVSVANLSSAIKILKENGYWIYASDASAKDSYSMIKYSDKCCLIVGSEGFGISRLVKENSDVLLKIPMRGHVNSLNASTAAAILVSEVYVKGM